MSFTLEQKFNTLCQITRAAHFEWRAAFKEMYPEKDALEMVLKYWEIVGKDTAKAYLRKIDPAKDVAKQLAKMIVDSSLAMGEEAQLINLENNTETGFEHLECPWVKWHEKYDALEEDQSGCDKWIQTILDEVNAKLGTHIEFETLCSIPAGQPTCKRVLRNK